jgi:1-aminocyclopropane-1-carboxylate deaminase/D-cysteine desulfhydrase-like pyridoxal-dependent ACC family enzyme
MRIKIFLLVLGALAHGSTSAATVNEIMSIMQPCAVLRQDLISIDGERRTYEDPSLYDDFEKLALARAFPKLQGKIPYIGIAQLPSPIIRAGDELVRDMRGAQLYIKRDDAIGLGARLAGNKPRKLGFIFADARAHGAESVLTFGGVGSNFVTATAEYAQKLGLRCYAMLLPQPTSSVVERNLLRMHHAGAHMVLCDSRRERIWASYALVLARALSAGKMPYVIPTGGSNARGALGFVNAAYELKEQIEQGVMPKPDHIYLATGSFGSLAGLLVGLRAAGLSIRATGVLVYPSKNVQGCAQIIADLARETNQLLHEADPSFPLFTWSAEDVVLNGNHGGSEYGAASEDGIEAQRIMKASTNIYLDTCYAAKAYAALRADGKAGIIQPHSVVLFWNTFDAQGVDDMSDEHEKLPSEFHRFFVNKSSTGRDVLQS